MITVIMRERITVSIRERRVGETTTVGYCHREEKERGTSYERKEEDKNGEDDRLRNEFFLVDSSSWRCHLALLLLLCPDDP